MAADVVSYVRKCDSCAPQRVRPLARRSPLTLFATTMTFQDIAVDLYGPLDRTAAGHRFILVITDRFTKLVRAIPKDGTSAVDCASVVLDYLVATYGPPDRLLSDGGPHFASPIWGQVCNLLSIEPKVTSPSHPQTNGQTERFNRTMQTILNHYVAEHPRSWEKLLGALTLAYNSRPHRSTGVAPLELVNPMGVSSWVFKDVPKTGAYSLTAQRGTAAEKRAQPAPLTRLVQLIPQMQAPLKATQGRYKRDHNKRLALRAEKLTVGGCAWLRDHAKEEGAGGKLTHVARGPYRVVSTDGPTVLLDVDEEHRRKNVAHVVRASGAAVEYPAQTPRAAGDSLLPRGGGRRPAVRRGPHRGPRDVARRDPPGPGLLDRVPKTHLDGRGGRPARDVAGLFAPRRALGVAPHVRRPAAGGPVRGDARRRHRRRRRHGATPGLPRLTPWVGAAAGRGGGGGGVSWGFLRSTGPSGRAGRRTSSGRATRESSTGRRGDMKHKEKVASLQRGGRRSTVVETSTAPIRPGRRPQSWLRYYHT